MRGEMELRLAADDHRCIETGHELLLAGPTTGREREQKVGQRVEDARDARWAQKHGGAPSVAALGDGGENGGESSRGTERARESAFPRRSFPWPSLAS